MTMFIYHNLKLETVFNSILTTIAIQYHDVFQYMFLYRPNFNFVK